MDRTNGAVLAAETLQIVEKGVYLSPDGREIEIGHLLQACLSGTRCFEPDQLRRAGSEALAQSTPALETHFEVANETTLAGASHLRQREPAGRIGVLNFASARNPGGGWLRGSQAQEESLVRSSGLYTSLLQCPGYYEHHRASRTLLYSHRLIYSPACPVFRDDAGDLLPDSYLVDFLTSPAPNAGALRRKQPRAAAQIEPVFRERIALLLGAALHLQIEDLVLGAWGCGVFQNDPRLVAAAFRDALYQDHLFVGRFRTVRFSVLDTTPQQTTIQPFVAAFQG
jgi:uncharacterized protein (TIGR02452 family)